jgi:hypothetical protein
MAGSAKVTPIPRRKAMISTTGSEDLLGRPVPRDSPSGIKPCFKPSMNSIRPIMTENNPALIIHEPSTPWRRINSWNSTR